MATAVIIHRDGTKTKTATTTDRVVAVVEVELDVAVVEEEAVVDVVEEEEAVEEAVAGAATPNSVVTSCIRQKALARNNLVTSRGRLIEYSVKFDII